MVACFRVFPQVRAAQKSVSIFDPLNGDSHKRYTEHRDVHIASQSVVETRIEYPIMWLVHFFQYDMWGWYCSKVKQLLP